MTILSDPRRSRRVTAGLGLIGFSVLLVAEDLVDAGGGSFYDTAVGHPDLMTASALILLVSAALTVPAIGAIIHQARGRGSLTAHLGGLFALLGALGHVCLTTVNLVMRSLAGGDPAQMRALEQRLDADPVLLTSFGVGLALLAFAAWRAGLIGWWAPAAVTAVVLVHAVLPDDPPAALSLTALSVVALVYGRLGVRTLRLSDADWDPAPTPSLIRATTSQS
jgi:hypothetical protein